MQVITLSKQNLDELSYQLQAIIAKDSFKSDIIIGIATGGIYVSRPLTTVFLQNNWQGIYHEIKLSRPSTKTKKKLQVRKVLQKLPYFMLDTLRKFEVIIFEHFKPKIYDTTKEDYVYFSDELIEDIKHANSILLVDDAIDTGATVLAVKNVIHSLNRDIDIRVAVLTTTHKASYLEPNYTIYKRTLLRCPWAMDYKGKDKIG